MNVIEVEREAIKLVSEIEHQLTMIQSGIEDTLIKL